MRKRQKKILLELTDTLSEAHSQIVRHIGRGEVEHMNGMLRQCQETAISMGETIEASEGEECVSVRRLEDYCEELFSISQNAGGTEASSDSKAGMILEKALNAVRYSITNDIKERLETVFLPYKASMWDSLESVWRKADADPDTDAYVIPIPYYDKNPDGSFREEHYEALEYPKDVPITHYREYPFEERHPDRIYIHNPYDEYNYVTSVHPFFYSKHLKELTDELVYIPYFVLADPDPDNDEQLEGISHFITTQAVINADKVIVQSESMRQAYIKVMTKYAGENTRKYWENKISGEGSPKFDKVEHTRKEELDIPDEWQKVLKKADGGSKKVILYNTGVQALLDNDEKMIDKIENVLQIFRANRDDVALLWRPHPLIKATISSMRPMLWERYRVIVERYMSEKWGIYDDSADLDRAIVISDAYYGDGSSVVELYKRTGKPIMIQNAGIIEEAD